MGIFLFCNLLIFEFWFEVFVLHSTLKRKNKQTKLEQQSTSKLIENTYLNIYLQYFRWLNTVLAVCEYLSFAKSWQEKGCSSQAENWQVKNILMKYFDWQVKCDVFVVSMATWTIEYNLKISLWLSLYKIPSIDVPNTQLTIINHYYLKLIWPNFNRRVFR